MLRDWHTEDIFDALRRRNWEGPFPFTQNLEYYVGEAHLFTRKDETLCLYIISDIGRGFTGKKSLEAVIAQSARARGELWLHRTRDAKWKKELLDWADKVSGPASLLNGKLSGRQKQKKKATEEGAEDAESD